MIQDHPQVTPQVDPEFRDAVPGLSEEERRHLEDSLVREGCRDALVVWAETGILLDGHNRLRICEQHGLPYRVEALSLPDRDAALDWIYAHQLGRRNLTPDLFKLVLGRLYNRKKMSRQEIAEAASQAAAERGAHLLSRKAESDAENPGSENPTKDSQRPRLATRLGDQFGVNRTTVMAAGKLATAFDEVRRENPAASQEEAMQEAKERTRRPKAEATTAPSNRGAVGGRQKTIDRIRALANEGHTRAQIATALGVKDYYVSELARDAGITLPDAAIGRVHKINPERVIRETVLAVDGAAAGLTASGVTAETIPADQATEWADALTAALKPINALLRDLRGRAQ